MIIRRLFVKVIEIYQKTLSPDTGWFRGRYPGGYCKFTPNCSQYCKESIEKRGAIIGASKGLWRIIRCNPWSKGGYDPV